jgi:hypothetical protein
MFYISTGTYKMDNQIAADTQINNEQAPLAVQESVQLPLSTLALIGGGQAITSFY